MPSSGSLTGAPRADRKSRIPFRVVPFSARFDTLLRGYQS